MTKIIVFSDQILSALLPLDLYHGKLGLARLARLVLGLHLDKKNKGEQSTDI